MSYLHKELSINIYFDKESEIWDKIILKDNILNAEDAAYSILSAKNTHSHEQGFCTNREIITLIVDVLIEKSFQKKIVHNCSITATLERIDSVSEINFRFTEKQRFHDGDKMYFEIVKKLINTIDTAHADYIKAMLGIDAEKDTDGGASR